MEGELKKRCGWCEGEALLTCGNCNQVFYCNRAHQKSHWPNHKQNCKPFIEVQCPTSGRYLVASRSLPAGSLILKESPIVIGPQAKSSLICLTCHVPIIENNFKRCPQCMWPMCSPNCWEHEKHLKECSILRKDKKMCGVPQQQGETPRYDLILVLRCLLLRSTNPSKWERIQTMESHAQKRKEDKEPHHVAAVRYLTEVCKVDFDKDIVHHVRGVVITNSINTKNATGATLRCLYSTISLLNHSCHPNSTLRSSKDHTLYIRTTVDVKKGDPLLFSYVSVLDPLWKRQEELMNIYYFSCKCKRCTDSTEMGTYYSSPPCSKCSKGFLTPTGDNLIWKCKECLHQEKLKEIIKQSDDLVEWIDTKKIVQKHLRLFLKGVLDKCHKYHFIYLQALQKALTHLKDSFSLEAIQIKKEIWKELLQINALLEPGLTRKTGVSLVELSTVILEEYEKGKSKKTQTELQNLLLEALKAVEEGISILNLEPSGSTEENWKELATLRGNRIKEQLSEYSEHK